MDPHPVSLLAIHCDGLRDQHLVGFVTPEPVAGQVAFDDPPGRGGRIGEPFGCGGSADGQEGRPGGTRVLVGAGGGVGQQPGDGRGVGSARRGGDAETGGRQPGGVRRGHRPDVDLRAGHLLSSAGIWCRRGRGRRIRCLLVPSAARRFGGHGVRGGGRLEAPAEHAPRQQRNRDDPHRQHDPHHPAALPAGGTRRRRGSPGLGGALPRLAVPVTHLVFGILGIRIPTGLRHNMKL